MIIIVVHWTTHHRSPPNASSISSGVLRWAYIHDVNTCYIIDLWFVSPSFFYWNKIFFACIYITGYSQRLSIMATVLLLLVIWALGGCALAQVANVSLHRAHASPVCNIRDYGAVGDNRTKDTHAFVAAIRACPGGTVHVPGPGIYLTGAMNFTSGQTLYVSPGATIAASQAIEDYPLVSAFPSYGISRDIGWKNSTCRYGAVIGGFELENVTIRGGGTIDGQGWEFWRKMDLKALNCSRPHLIEFQHARNLLIRDLTLLNSPFWTVHLIYSDTIEVRNLTILAPVDRGNTDGIDPDSSSNVLIRDCYIKTGDDAVAIKSGINYAGLQTNIPSTNITLINITAAGHGGISLGSETSGGIRHIIARDIHMTGQHGMRIKTCKGRGSVIEDVHVTNAEGGVVLYMKHSPGCNSTGPWPAVRNLHFKNVTGPCDFACGDDPICDPKTFTFDKACGHE